MIDRFAIKNFKSLRDVILNFGNLNLLFGCNGAGKSSVIQALLLLKQSVSETSSINKLKINGKLVDLGTAQDIFCQMASDSYISFSLSGTEIKFVSEFEYADIYDENMKAVMSDGNIETLLRKVCYLTANHIGPQNKYSTKNWEDIFDINPLGNEGEYAVAYLAKYGTSYKVGKGMCCSGAKSDCLVDQVTAWMRFISPGVRITAVEDVKMQEAIMSVGYETNKLNMTYFSPVNAGFGITHVLPVIVALLTSDSNTLVLLENPESHLHPKGQMAMAELMARAANNGVQIICESHSDHIINGVRVAVKEKIMSHEDVMVAYFDKDENQETDITIIDMDVRGNLSEFPKGLLDEWGNSMMRLLRADK